MTNLEKCIEYCNNLCYSINGRKFLKKEVICMQDAMIKGIYAKLDRKNESTKTEKIIKKIGTYLKNKYYIYAIKVMAKKVDFSKYIERNKEICSGNYVIKGTRITPLTITEYIVSICEENNSQVEEVIEKTLKNYPSLNEDKILLSVLFCIKKGYIKIK